MQLVLALADIGSGAMFVVFGASDDCRTFPWTVRFAGGGGFNPPK